MYVISKTFVWAAWDDEELELEHSVLGYSMQKEEAYQCAAQEYEELCIEGMDESETIEEEDTEEWEDILQIEDIEKKYQAMHSFRDRIWNNDLWDDDMEETRERGPHGYYIEVHKVQERAKRL